MSCSGMWSALAHKCSKIKTKLKPNLTRKADSPSSEKDKNKDDLVVPAERTNYVFYYDIDSISSDGSDGVSSDEESFEDVTLTLRQQIVAKNKIMNQVKPYIEETIIVWCPVVVLPPDYVASLLNEFGGVEDFQNRWIPEEKFCTQAAFGGMVVQYQTRDMAMKAVKSIPLRSRFVQSISLTTMLNYLAESEIHHPQCNKSLTCVTIKSIVPMRDHKYQQLKDYLFCIGDIADIIDERSNENATICKVWFVYASQAYIAMLLLNECHFSLIPLKVVVKKTKKEKDIFSEVRVKISDYMERNSFP